MPAVSPRPMHIPAGLPLDETTRLEIIEAGQANVINLNVRQRERGTLEKRLGFGPLSSVRLDDTSRPAGARIFQRGDAIAVIDGTMIDVYAPTASAGPNVTRGRVPEASVKLRSAPAFGTFMQLEDAAYVAGYVILSYLVYVGTTAYHGIAILDESTGAIVRGPETIDSSTSISDVRLGSYGPYVLAFTADTAAAQIRVQYLDTESAATIETGWHLAATVTGFNTGFDCGNAASDDHVAMAFGSTGNSSRRITVKAMTVMGESQTVNIDTTTALDADDARCVAISENGDTLWVAYFDGVIPTVVGLDPANISGTPLATAIPSVSLGALTPDSVQVCTRSGSGKAVVFYRGFDGTAHALNYASYAWPIKTSSGTAAADGFLAPFGGAYIVSRPFLRNGRVYAHFDSHGFGGFEGVLCDCTPENLIPYMRPVAVALPRGEHGRSVSSKYRTVPLDSFRYLAPLLVVEGILTAGARMVEYNFGDPGRWRASDLNGSTYLNGGVNSQFDGARVFELGFLVAPATPQTSNATGTGLTLTHGRCYVVTFEHVDGDGRRHISGVSAPCAISGSQTNKAVTVKVPPCAITSRGDSASLARSSVRARFWATADANVGQPPYHLVGEVVSDPDLFLLTFSDTMQESDLATQELLYGAGDLPGTNGASQDHRAPRGWTCMVSYNGLLVGAQGSAIEWTAQNIDGEGVWTSPVFAGNVQGSVTALEAQDGSVFAFTERRIFAMAGDPPSDNGSSGGLGTPRALACDLGSIDGITVVTSMGIFFRSARGIEILNRGGSVQWIGERVRQTLATFPVLTSAVLDDVNGLVRFSLAAASSGGVVSGNGRTLIFDLTLGTWIGVDDQRGSNASEPSQDACMATVAGKRRYAWLGADGVVHYEKLPTDSDAYLDGSSFVTSQYAIPPWKLGLQQEQRVYEVTALVEQHSACGLTIEIAHDLGPYGVDPDKVWTESAALSQRRFPFRPEARGSAIAYRLRDTAPAVNGTGRGFTFIGLSADVAPIQGATRGTPRLDTSLRR